MSGTTNPHGTEAARSPRSPRPVILAAGLIVLAGLAAYHNSFTGPFIFDDPFSIAENGSIQHLWPIWRVLSPPAEGQTVTARPVVNLTLAVNYAISGLEVWTYHVFNLVVHILAGLTLFGVLRRTLLLPRLKDRFGRSSTFLATAVALIWTVHPLQTQAVTYIVQRAESIMGLFYLLTLYCVIRGAEAGRPRRWYVLAILACLLGMASKEVMVTAPLIVLLHDRTFIAGSFKEALRRRWGVYACLAATWGLLAFLQLTMGCFKDVVNLTPWQFARTELGVILHYVRLCFWPHPLCLDYSGWPVANTVFEILPGAIVVGGLLAATLWALVRRPVWGFVGAWFFMPLAPTSSMLPLTDIAFDHRMYLSLGGVVVVVVMVAHMLRERWARIDRLRVVRRLVAVALPAAAVAALGITTVLRNGDYQSAVTIWRKTLDQAPWNSRAHNNLGMSLTEQGGLEEAMDHYRQALQMKPDSAEAHNNMGIALSLQGRHVQAAEHFHEALRIQPGKALVHYNLGMALAAQGKSEQAVGEYREALRLRPDMTEAYNNLGVALARMGKLEQAIEAYGQALRLKPDIREVHYNLALVLVALNRLDEGIEHYQEAARLAPDDAETHFGLAGALEARGYLHPAVEHYERALALARASGRLQLSRRIEAHLEMIRSGVPNRPQGPSAQPAGR